MDEFFAKYDKQNEKAKKEAEELLYMLSDFEDLQAEMDEEEREIAEFNRKIDQLIEETLGDKDFSEGVFDSDPIVQNEGLFEEPLTLN